ncbi:MAG: DUF3800 domain-containing protein [Anaerolineae bacterium]|jgi:hypothetical protein|nr:DUF3800 domain-containing protein [Anaerolineae bacterium]MBT7191753.1 DUF3800 domain-containing protein [Anaerolineae bacterium]MBT7989131.1 DUF3800 domain-containing protein [Anaerolineae bacterium]
MSTHVYFDESGDLGWSFEKPYGRGGSSRYLTISFLLTPKAASKYPKRLVRQLYKKYKIPPKQELKGSQLTDEQREFFVTKTIAMLESKPLLQLLSITVKKENVFEHIRADHNKLYNYMIRLTLLREIKDKPLVILFPDPRSVKVQSGNSMIDYLQTVLWFDHNSRTKLQVEEIPSEKSLNLKFIDWVANTIGRKYERGVNGFADRLLPYICSKELYFRR